MTVWILLVILDAVKNEQGLRRNFPLTIGLRIGSWVFCMAAYGLFYKHKQLEWVIAFLLLLLGTLQLIFGIIEQDSLGEQTLPCCWALAADFEQMCFRLLLLAFSLCW